MAIDAILVGSFQVNCYLVTDEAGHAVVIDPGADAGRIGAYLRQRKLAVSAILCTHGHMDHCSALAAVAAEFPAPVGMHPDDAAWAFGAGNQVPPYYGIPERPPAIARPLADGLRFTDGGLEYEVIATPGHTPGGVCFHFPALKSIFTGDTLFAGSVGRTDLPGSDDAALHRSLEHLMTLPADTTVYPGHGDRTTIGREKRTNPFL